MPSDSHFKLLLSLYFPFSPDFIRENHTSVPEGCSLASEWKECSLFPADKLFWLRHLLEMSWKIKAKAVMTMLVIV